MKTAYLLAAALLMQTAFGADLTSIPGPDDQGGMLMPMVTLTGTTLHVHFEPLATPELGSLEYWSPGDTFLDSSSWNALLDPVDGQGALFNNQYGFTFSSAMGTLPVPPGLTLGIRLVSRSSELLESWNYSRSLNLFDEVFTEPGDQVLWLGTMWHNYFTLPKTAAPGVYSARFEFFLTGVPFTVGTGAVDYSATARNATADPAYTPATVDYVWKVVPEPSSTLLLVAASALLRMVRRRPRA